MNVKYLFFLSHHKNRHMFVECCIFLSIEKLDAQVSNLKFYTAIPGCCSEQKVCVEAQWTAKNL